jgi:hypothetical protein
MPSEVFMHFFERPSLFHDVHFWGPRLPRKVGPTQESHSAEGWGIRLVERPDWPMFAALMSVLVLMSGMVAGLYAWATGDRPTGVAIGTWLTTVQTLGATAVFFWWS